MSPSTDSRVGGSRAGKELSRTSVRSRVRRRLTRLLLPTETTGERLPAAIRHLQGISPAPAASDEPLERPIFILSAGWRSGSTLLQRLACSDGSTLIWGEPYGELQPLQRLAASVEFRVPRDWMFDQVIDADIDLRRSFIANLYPELWAVKGAHRAYLDAFLREPAVARGFDRFGAKFVRMSAGHAAYLRWLYPGARLVFLVRDPVRAFASYRGREWMLLRPHRVDTAARFFLHWGRLAESFVLAADELDAKLVRYEDLVGDREVIEGLEEHLVTRLDRAILGARPADGLPPPDRVPARHRALCRILVGDVRRTLGYPVGR